MAPLVSTDQRCSSQAAGGAQSRTARQGAVGGAAEGTRSPGGTGPGLIRVQTQPEDLAATPGSAVPQWAYSRSHAMALRPLLFLSNRNGSCPSRFCDSQGGQWPGRAGQGSGASPLAGEELDGNTGSGSSSGVKIDWLPPSHLQEGFCLFAHSVWEQRQPLNVTGNACQIEQALAFLEKPFPRRRVNPIRRKQV